MNKIQKITFMVMVALDSLIAMFPPWHMNYKGQLVNKGYSFIFFPPKGSVITLSTLSVQIIIVTFVCSALIYYFKTPRRPPVDLDKQVKAIMSALIDGDEYEAVKAMKAIIEQQ